MFQQLSELFVVKIRGKKCQKTELRKSERKSERKFQKNKKKDL